MSVKYSIHPSIGIARIGNSSQFYLSPIDIGKRPIECDQQTGDELCLKNGKKIEWYKIPKEERNPAYVKKFKDAEKKVKRQAAKFRIYKPNPNKPEELIEVDLTKEPNIKKVTWKVHLANKKSAWYHFDQYSGNLMIGPGNKYKEDGKRNPDITDPKIRRQLIIDFGPRELSSPCLKLTFDMNTVQDYPATLPWHQLDCPPKIGKPVQYLGAIITDSKMNLLVLGGRGNAGGDEPYSTFAGGDGWYDDVSDGPVLCELQLADGPPQILTAWVIVAPPKFAPELVNITTLDDTMFDVSVRHLKAAPQIYDKENPKYVHEDDGHGLYKGWNPDFIVSYERDIKPIIDRIGHYRWVANVPSMMDFCNPSFDLTDNSKENEQNRKTYFEYFRTAVDNDWDVGDQSKTLFSDGNNYIEGIPLMPLNAGSNAVSNKILNKFVALSKTQYFFLKQWSDGKFTKGKAPDLLGMIPLDHADVGNSVGLPMCPGVEVTWSVKNPAIYEKPYHIKHKPKDLENYFKEYCEKGLNPDRDETAPEESPDGCEPGDLTKRMAIPWTSDLFECNIQRINFTDEDKNLDKDQLEKAPTYLSYWWPPQSPWDVILGVTDPTEDEEEIDEMERKKRVIEELKDAGVPAGQQVNYIRGINTHMEMVRGWWHLGFILNQNEGKDREKYPYFVEKERNHKAFKVVSLATGDKGNIGDVKEARFIAAFYLKEEDEKPSRIKYTT